MNNEKVTKAIFLTWKEFHRLLSKAFEHDRLWPALGQSQWIISQCTFADNGIMLSWESKVISQQTFKRIVSRLSQAGMIN